MGSHGLKTKALITTSSFSWIFSASNRANGQTFLMSKHFFLLQGLENLLWICKLTTLAVLQPNKDLISQPWTNGPQNSPSHTSIPLSKSSLYLALPPYPQKNTRHGSQERPRSPLPSPARVCPLVEAPGECSPLLVCKPFSLVELKKIKADLRSYSDNPGAYIDSFQHISLYELTWKDVLRILGQILSYTEQDRVIGKARKFANSHHLTDPTYPRGKLL